MFIVTQALYGFPENFSAVYSETERITGFLPDSSRMTNNKSKTHNFSVGQVIGLDHSIEIRLNRLVANFINKKHRSGQLKESSKSIRVGYGKRLLYI